MNFLDWIVIAAYLSAVIVIASLIARSQRSTQDYYLAGRRIRWWQSGASTMATQLGAISFISAPAFVAMKEGGGLKWLCYEFGVPLALILVMAVIIPVFHRRHYVSIYEYLEERYDAGTRSLVSLIFQIGRCMATAISVLAGGLILSTALSISTQSAILLIGIITIIYDALGGIRIVVLSDFVQMSIIAVGLLICGGVALHIVGWETAWNSLSPDRFMILDFKHWGTSAKGAYAFWPMMIGGFFLYASYYGCDQSQVQRELTVGNVDDVRKSLLFNAVGRFPLVLLYCLIGVLVGALFSLPGSIEHVASTLHLAPETASRILAHDPDRMIPMFILSYLPHGVIGLLLVAIMAALMSSLDSSLNSLSAVTMRDFYQRFFKRDGSEKHYVSVSKIITVIWGVFLMAFALAFAGVGEATRETTIVLTNAVGSMLYGPILAVFLAGILVNRIKPFSIKIGVMAGILVNLCLWIFTPVSWMWWNFTGFAASGSTAFLTSFLWKAPKWKSREKAAGGKRKKDSNIPWPFIYLLLVFYFFLIIFVTYLIEHTR